MQACSLSVTNLACRRGDRLLFRGLSFALGGGEAMHLTGANGIGKSSLIRIVAGLMRPYAGAVERSGTVGLMDDNPALDPETPLGQALGFWSALDGVGLLARESCTDRAGLHDLLDVPVRHLSTGQRKRAALARLQGQQAHIWLLDEPLNGLDREGVALVEELLAEHCAEGGIALIASHQPIAVSDRRILALADYVPDFVSGDSA